MYLIAFEKLVSLSLMIWEMVNACEDRPQWSYVPTVFDFPKPNYPYCIDHTYENCNYITLALTMYADVFEFFSRLAGYKLMTMWYAVAGFRLKSTSIWFDCYSNIKSAESNQTLIKSKF